MEVLREVITQEPAEAVPVADGHEEPSIIEPKPEEIQPGVVVNNDPVDRPLSPTISLTDKEVQVLEELSYGATAQQVASKINVHEASIFSLYSRIYRKLGARNAPDAMRLCFYLGILKPHIGYEDTDFEQRLSSLDKAELKFISVGLSPGQVAAATGELQKVVADRRQLLVIKLGATSLGHAVRHAIEFGILPIIEDLRDANQELRIPKKSASRRHGPEFSLTSKNARSPKGQNKPTKLQSESEADQVGPDDQPLSDINPSLEDFILPVPTMMRQPKVETPPGVLSIIEFEESVRAYLDFGGDPLAIDPTKPGIRQAGKRALQSTSRELKIVDQARLDRRDEIAQKLGILPSK